MSEKTVSISDIAKLANVSVATVSRVLNQNGRFSKETEEKVMSVIEKYDYQPNQLARGLRVSKSKIIGIVVPDITNEFFAKLTLIIQNKLFSQGYLSFICNTNEESVTEKQIIDMIKAQRVSGIIYISGQNEYSPDIDVPMIYIDRKPAKLRKTDVLIKSDDRNGGYLATKELLECGCKKIIGVSYENIVGHDLRIEGYKIAMEEAGMEPIVEKVRYENHDEGENEIYYLIGKYSDVDGVFFTTDYLAVGALRGLNSIQKKVPEEIKIVGFDDIDISRNVYPQLTTVHQDIQKMGDLATEMIIRQISGEKIDENEFTIGVSLTKRASTQ